ncbi:hypothetical protein F5I97DRAFT_7031 [Phlebopus sp. FC_14]|nr:hypothetical protein F5I97DRAFT_7031 [Phlebopus sp. FC_14]
MPVLVLRLIVLVFQGSPRSFIFTDGIRIRYTVCTYYTDAKRKVRRQSNSSITKMENPKVKSTSSLYLVSSSSWHRRSTDLAFSKRSLTPSVRINVLVSTTQEQIE